MSDKVISHPITRPFGGSGCRTGMCIWLLIFLFGGQHEARSQESCTALRIDQAGGEYAFGRFTETFRLLKPCVPDGFSERTYQADAYRLLALSYLATDSLVQARESIGYLLRYDSRFRPNPQTDPPLFVDMVNDMRPKWYTWLWKGGEWYKWAGRGLIVGSAIALPMILKKDELPLLPNPPGTPPAN